MSQLQVWFGRNNNNAYLFWVACRRQQQTRSSHMVLLADLYRRIYFMGGWGNLPGSTSSLFQAVIPRLGLRFILRARLMIMWLKCGMEEVLTKKLAHAGFEQHLLNIPWEHELRLAFTTGIALLPAARFPDEKQTGHAGKVDSLFDWRSTIIRMWWCCLPYSHRHVGEVVLAY